MNIAVDLYLNGFWHIPFVQDIFLLAWLWSCERIKHGPKDKSCLGKPPSLRCHWEREFTRNTILKMTKRYEKKLCNTVWCKETTFKIYRGNSTNRIASTYHKGLTRKRYLNAELDKIRRHPHISRHRSKQSLTKAPAPFNRNSSNPSARNKQIPLFDTFCCPSIFKIPLLPRFDRIESG